WIRLRISRERFCETDRIAAVVGNGSRPVERLRDAFGSSTLGSLPSQSVLHNAILAVRAANLLPQIRVLGNGHALKLGNEKILRLLEVFLQRVELFLLFTLGFHNFVFLSVGLLRVQRH